MLAESTRSCKTFIKLEMSFSLNILRKPPGDLKFVFLGTSSKIVLEGGNLNFVLVPNTFKAFYEIILKCKMHKQSKYHMTGILSLRECP